MERDDLPGFVVKRGGGNGTGKRPGAGGARRPLFRWRPLQQFHNWVDRTRIADVPPDERATVRRQLTEIKEALEKQLAELEQLQDDAQAETSPERQAESVSGENSSNSPS